MREIQQADIELPVLDEVALAQGAPERLRFRPKLSSNSLARLRVIGRRGSKYFEAEIFGCRLGASWP
jgi:hypothetical protein